jgi:hypothetical protein
MKYCLWVLLLLEVSVVAVPAPAQSLADVARKERERRAVGAGKTYTNLDIISSAAESPAVEASQPPDPTGLDRKDAGPGSAAVQPATKPAEAKPAGPTDNKGRDEKYWRTAFDAVRTDLRRAQDEIQLHDLKLNELHTLMLQGSDLYNRENRLRIDLDAASTQLETAHRNAEKARQRLMELEEELRRSGGPIGWSR